MDELKLLNLIAEAHAEVKIARRIAFANGLLIVFFGILILLK